MSSSKWICDREEILIQSPVLEVIRKTCHSSEDSSRVHPFYALRSPDWCNILPVTRDGKVVLVRQFRIGIDEDTLEFPGGIIDPTDADVPSGAIREMAEETGYVPAQGCRCESVGWSHPNPAMQNNRSHFFVIGPVEKTSSQNLDAGEQIDVVEVPISRIPELVRSGQIRHSLILNTLFFLMLNSAGGEPLLANAISGFSGR